MSFEPLLLPILVLWSAMLYVTHRGLARNEFRRRWHSGWHYFATNSVSYWVSTAVNFMFLGVCTFMIYESLFNPSFDPPTIAELPPEAVKDYSCTAENPQFCRSARASALHKLWDEMK